MLDQTSYLSIFLHKHMFKIWKFTPKKRVNRDILNLKYYIFGIFINFIVIISQFSYISSLNTLSMGKTWFNIAKNWIILLQLDLKHITRVNFYPSDNNFTQALLVTNIISAWYPLNIFCCTFEHWIHFWHILNTSTSKPVDPAL